MQRSRAVLRAARPLRAAPHVLPAPAQLLARRALTSTPASRAVDPVTPTKFPPPPVSESDAKLPPAAPSPASPLPPPPPPTAGQLPPPPPPPVPQVPKITFWKRFLQGVGRVTLFGFVGGAGLFYYVALRDRSPGTQDPFDPAKRNLVILGTGWGATSLLKSIDTNEYNVIVVSPKNFFLFTPLLPSVAVGTLNPRSIITPIRYITRHKSRQVSVIEAEAQEIDPVNKTVTFSDTSGIKGSAWSTTIPYDYLVVAVGAETQTFGIPGVKEHSVFMKELADAERMQDRFVDCVESAAFPGQPDAEIDRLLHAVVVGGGPTGIELSGELHDFLEEDLKMWYPELAGRVRISLIEALPSVLPMFSKQLIDYTLSTFKEQKIDVLTKTMVKEIREKSVVVKTPEGETLEIPCGIVVWAGGNKPRKIAEDLMKAFPAAQTNRRGLSIDDHLRVAGASDIFAVGDCTSSSYAPTAQVASQQGAYLAKVLQQIAKADQLKDRIGEMRDEKKTLREIDQVQRQLEKAERLRPFHYSHQGSLAYIGSDKAIADLSLWERTFSSGGVYTFWFWRSAYISSLFSLRNRTLVAADWLKVKLFGRDVSRE